MSTLRAFAVTSSHIPRLATRAIVDAIRVIRNDTVCLEHQIDRLRLRAHKSGRKNYVVAMRCAEPTIAGSGKAVPLQSLVSTSI